MRIKNNNLISKFPSLQTGFGFWNDSEVWDDSENWTD